MTIVNSFRFWVFMALVLVQIRTPLPLAVADTTGSTGGGQAFHNEQPSLGLNYVVRISGSLDDLGEVGMFGGNFAPAEWALANGQLLNIQQNFSLFEKLGTAFGGDGVTSFALPDLRGRTPIGVGSAPGLPSYSLGQKIGGDEGSPGVVPAHQHTIGSNGATQFAGESVSTNLQPSLALTPLISTVGTYPSPSVVATGGSRFANFGFGGFEPFLGELTWIAHEYIPSGWRVANGDLLDIATNQALFSILGTMYGGNGETNFRLPDLRGRAAVGTGNGPGLTSRNDGNVFGAHEESLTEAHLPAHSHSLLNGLGSTQLAGQGVSQSNLQPSLAMTHLIAEEGVYPSQSVMANAGSSLEFYQLGSGGEPYYASVSMFAGNYAPVGFRKAQGQLQFISSNPALFSLLGTNFGGDGEVTFGLPDLRGRLSVHAGFGFGVPSRSLGEKFGSESSSLTFAQLGTHSHAFDILQGDYNNDGIVNVADYAVWLANLGAPAGTLPNDLYGTVVGQVQYDTWKTNFGFTMATLTGSDGAEVPEPSCLLLLVLCSFTMLSFRRSFSYTA